MRRGVFFKGFPSILTMPTPTCNLDQRTQVAYLLRWLAITA